MKRCVLCQAHQPRSGWRSDARLWGLRRDAGGYAFCTKWTLAALWRATQAIAAVRWCAAQAHWRLLDT